MSHASSWSLYDHGFVRVAACTPTLRVADPKFNLAQTLELAQRADDSGCLLAVFPELGLWGGGQAALLFQEALLDEVHDQLAALVEASLRLTPIVVVGVPVRVEHQLFDCAVVIHRGTILAAIPKTYPTDAPSPDEDRQFSSALDALAIEISLCGAEVPFGNDIVLEARGISGFALHVEIGEDLKAPVSPSTCAALAGATLLINQTAHAGNAGDWPLLCRSQSLRCAAAYLSSSGELGESTNDSLASGGAVICEDGELLASSPRGSVGSQLTLADIDLDRLIQQRARLSSFAQNARSRAQALRELRHVSFSLDMPTASVPLRRSVDRFPFVPKEPDALDECCRDTVATQVQRLAHFLKAGDIRRVVLEVSGDFDSTHAALIAAQSYDALDWPRTDILGCLLPRLVGDAGLDPARQLIQTLGFTSWESDGPRAAPGTLKQDAKFERPRRAERASVLSKLANQRNGVVLGVADLTQRALADPYEQHDSLSDYEVNSSLPRTLVPHVIRWLARRMGTEVSVAVENNVIGRLASELGPAPEREAQQESARGPFEVHDFNLYYLGTRGYRPSKVLFLAQHAWADKSRGFWPKMMPPDQRREYDLDALHRFLEAFITRYIRASELGRVPPHLGAPKEMSATSWLNELSRAYPEVYTDFTGS